MPGSPARSLLHRKPDASHNVFGESSAFRPGSMCAPSMGAVLEMKVLPRADHSERSEAQLREGDRTWGGSAERNREPMNKNQI